jgi:hypothetical protein
MYPSNIDQALNKLKYFCENQILSYEHDENTVCIMLNMYNELPQFLSIMILSRLQKSLNEFKQLIHQLTSIDPWSPRQQLSNLRSFLQT